MGSDSCGKSIPAFKTLGSRYHLISSVEVTPEAVLRRRVLSLKPDLEAAGPATIICGLPLPRYVRDPCCTDTTHMTNRKEGDYEDILRTSSNTCMTILKAEGEKAGMTIAAFDILSSFNSADSLIQILSSAGVSVWRDDHPVHLTAAAYSDIAAVIANQAVSTSGQPRQGTA